MRRALLAWLLLTSLPGVALGADLGRLFLSPTERAIIDAARHGAAQAGDKSSAHSEGAVQARADAPPELPAEAITVDGYIARSAGASTVWINGRAGASGKLVVPAGDGQRVRVPLANGAGQVALKPGQSFDPGSHQVSDAYEQRPPAHE